MPLELVLWHHDFFDSIAVEVDGDRLVVPDLSSSSFRKFPPPPGLDGVCIVQTPIQVPSANAYAERFVRSIREECLDRVILFGERRLRHAIDEFVAHYHRERNHQGLGNELIAPQGDHRGGTYVWCCERLGGLLRYYDHAA